jgi:MFS family permease
VPKDEAVGEDSLRYQGWRVTAACGVGVFFSTLPFYTFAVFLKPLSEEFGWSRQTVSSAYGTMAFAAAVCAPLAGYLLDRRGALRVVVPCATAAALAFASLSALTPRLWHLRAIFALLGLMVVGSAALAYARVIPAWFDRRRGVAFAVLMSAAAVGGIVHPVAAEALIARAGWRAAYLILGGLALVLGLPTILRFVKERPSAGGADTAGEIGVPARQAFRSRAFWVLVGLFFGGTLVSNGAMVHLAALLSDRGVAASEAARAVSIMGAATLAGRLLTGWLIDRFLATRVAFVLIATAAAGTFLLAGARSWAQGVAGAALIGFGAGGESDVAPYLLSRYFGLRSVSTLYAIVWTAIGCSGFVGPMVMARAFDRTGSYEPVLVALAAATLGVATLTLLLPGYAIPARSPAHGQAFPPLREVRAPGEPGP